MARRELADGFELDDDPARVDVDAVHRFISEESYWGVGRPRALVERAIGNSARVMGLYRGTEQIGFARAVSDGAIIAYLADVYVLAEFRGRGLGLELVREIIDGGPYEGLTWMLHTASQQKLYEQVGFKSHFVYPLMERRRRKVSGEAPYEDSARPQR